jgi:hypothetical protein
VNCTAKAAMPAAVQGSWRLPRHGEKSNLAKDWRFPDFSGVDMHDHASNSDHTIQPAVSRVQRARSLPSARPFRVAVFFSSIHYLGLICCATALVCVFLKPGQMAINLFVGCMIFSAISWLVAFFKRRNTFCPLCKGTPLINSGARVHSRAWRLFPLNHGVTATLSVMVAQKFRCMYCGSDYDLLKPRTRLLHGDPVETDDSAYQDR